MIDRFNNDICITIFVTLFCIFIMLNKPELLKKISFNKCLYLLIYIKDILSLLIDVYNFK
jgi:hypothetical protein